MKHTPGPWTYSWDDDGFFYVNEPRIVITGCPGDEAEGNARLIAAAPDMLDALQQAREALRIGGYPRIATLIDAAIAKAEAGMRLEGDR